MHLRHSRLVSYRKCRKAGKSAREAVSRETTDVNSRRWGRITTRRCKRFRAVMARLQCLPRDVLQL